MSTYFRLQLKRDIHDAMLQQALDEAPNECCGLLAGTISADGEAIVQVRYPLVNAAASPTEYLSDPLSMLAAEKDMRRRQIEIVAIYHSHPKSAPVPSKTDLARAVYMEVMYLIFSLKREPPEVRGWWLTAEKYTPADWIIE